MLLPPMDNILLIFVKYVMKQKVMQPLFLVDIILLVLTVHNDVSAVLFAEFNLMTLSNSTKTDN